MNRPEGVLGYQVDSLLDSIERDLTERKRAITEEAERNARELIRSTRRRCRRRGQQAVAEERARMAAALAKTKAALASRRRRREQAIDSKRLERGLDWLQAALQSRWSDPAACRNWVDAAVAEAAAMLPATGWQVETAPGPDASTLAEALSPRTSDAAVVSSLDIQAGLRIRCGNACLDMTVEGLMAHETSLAGQLLADLHELDAGKTESHDD